MLTPNEFPYITAIHVNDCYAYQDFDIKLNDDKPFSHLVLTGKNGSGKSTILRSVDFWISKYLSGIDVIATINQHIKNIPNRVQQFGKDDTSAKLWQLELTQLGKIALSQNTQIRHLVNQKNEFVYSYIKAERNSKINPVSTVTKDDDFVQQLSQQNSSDFFIKQFKQYLVNKKVGQAFSMIDRNDLAIKESQYFFNLLNLSFQKMLEDSNLELVFVKDNFEFYLQLSNGQQITFENLSDGFSALISILMDLFMRVDIIRKEVKDFSYNPCGIVLIDEPETHLHLKLQEEVMPLLTGLFPNIQFIVATHSPAVMASIKNATIFDLTTKTTENDRIVGSSYSELMVSHFGLDNEYSSIADGIFKEINATLRLDNTSERNDKLQIVLAQNERYLSPAMRLELESMILDNQ
jgi:predicted ATP-binding protein involved in virulence